MIQLGGFASTTVHRFQFLHYLHALVQYQQQEIIKKEKPQVQIQKQGTTPYSAALQKILLKSQGKMVRFNNVPQAHEGKAQGMSHGKPSAMPCKVLPWAVHCHSFWNSRAKRTLWRTTKLKNTKCEIKLDPFKPEMFLRTDQPRQANRTQPEGRPLLPNPAGKFRVWLLWIEPSGFNLCLKTR